jgi:hypothetical protein
MHKEEYMLPLKLEDILELANKRHYVNKDDEFTSDVIKALMYHHNISVKEAERIFWVGYDKGHSNGHYEVVLEVYSLIGLYEDLLSYRNNS